MAVDRSDRVRRMRSVRRPTLAAVLGVLVASTLPVLASSLATPAAADPGHPGTPDDPVELFHESFENIPGGTTSQMLNEYVGAGGHARWG